jgi:hypothetical protein
MLSRCAYFAAISMLLVVNAQAAMIQELDEQVFVNRGEGFRGIAGATEAAPGSLVRTGHTGRAQIVYDNGCKVIVEPDQTVEIQDPPPRCRGAGWLPAAAVVGGIITAIIVTEDDDKPVSP